jgi:predicted TIM-barrel fold metal-dependent hydrolase
MKSHFTDIVDIDYPIVDADAHVNEPPDLWQERVPAKWNDRAPRVLHTDEGDFWSFEEGKRQRPVGLTATAGLSFVQFRPSGLTYESMRAGSFDTKARLADLDVDGIYAQVLYPSVTLTGARLYADERELQIACVRAYNEWLAEFCEGSEGRLVGQAIMPTTGVDDALAEVDLAVKLGHKGVVISRFPNGSFDTEPDDDRFWGYVEDAGIPVAVHIGSFVRGADSGGKGPNLTELAFLGSAGASKAGAHTLPVTCALLFSGIFEQFPSLKIVLVESNIGWIPTLLEQLDDMFLRYRWFTGATEKMRLMPSELFHRNFWATFMIDTVGMDLRYRMNLAHVMWSTDYPHTGCDWPNSRVTIERVFRGLPLDEVRRFLHTNAVELYGLDVPDALPPTGRP